MKTLLLSTAMLAVISTAAVAQDAAAPAMFRAESDPMNLRASDFIGMRVYASEADLDADEYAGTQDGWSDIGEINDVILSRDGTIDAVLVDIGGFLGAGERQVAVGMEAIRFVGDAATTDDTNDFFLVMTAAQADLEAAPDYMMGAPMMGTDGVTSPGDDMSADDTAMVTDGDAVVTEDVATDAATDMAATDREPITRDGFMVAEADYLTSEKLVGAGVYDANDDRIGEVGNLVLADDGQVSEAIIDVGGFLGIGEKPVSLMLTDVDILRNEGGDDVRVYVSMTKEQLDALPRFDG